MRDVRVALRAMRRNLSSSALGAVTLGLAIGGATTIFSVLNAVVLRPLPYPASDRLMIVRDANPPKFPEFSVAVGRYLEWTTRTRAFESLAAWQATGANLTGSSQPVRLRAAFVTANLFSTLGVTPLAGRTFTDAEDRPGADLEVIVSEGLWRDQFASAPDLLGRKLVVDDRPLTVVGIMPRSFGFPNALTQAWMPAAFTDRQRREYGSHYISVIGRLKPGTSVDAARADQARAAREIEAIDRGNIGWTSLVIPYLEYQVRGVKAGVWLLSGAVGVLLLIACANVANLLLARGVSRQHEFGLRAALGASRARLVRQMLAENVVVGAVGAALGLALAAGGLALLAASPSTNLPRADSIHLDPAALTFAALLALFTPLVFGVVPALQLSRTDLREWLMQGGRTGGGALRARTRAALIIAEIGLAVTLVAAAVLLLRSFTRVTDVSPGFQTDRQLVVGVSLPSTRYPDDAQKEGFWRTLIERVEAVPGVETAAVSQSVPFLGDFVDGFSIPGRTPDERTQWPSANFYAVTPDYFKTMGIPILRGRAFSLDDRTTSARVALISQSLASRYFGRESPLGKPLIVTQGPKLEPAEIVGVVGDVKQYSLDAPTSLQMYEPASQHPYFGGMNLIVSARVPPEGMTATLRGVLADLDPHLPILTVRTLASYIDASVGPRRLTTMLLGLFAAVALTLAVVGTYGLVAFTVGQRTQEIGIRVALGAPQGRVLGLVFRQGLGLAAAGAAVGLLGAFAAARLVSSQLFDSSTGDGVVAFVAAPLALLLAVTLACYVPARRALKIEPVRALRQM